MILDVVVPVLHRPRNVATVMESLRATAPDVVAWFVCEVGDDVEADEVARQGGNVMWHSGTFAQKVNHAYRHTVADWLLLIGDDVVFHPGWREALEPVAADDGAHVIGTNDLHSRPVKQGRHATHPMVRRAYVDELGASWDGPGIVCHEGYRHWYVDQEIVTVAMSRDAWRPCLDSWVEHMHPLWGLAPHDGVYAQGMGHAHADQRLWNERSAKYAR